MMRFSLSLVEDHDPLTAWVIPKFILSQLPSQPLYPSPAFSTHQGAYLDYQRSHRVVPTSVHYEQQQEQNSKAYQATVDGLSFINSTSLEPGSVR
jgi:hypothetical protein